MNDEDFVEIGNPEHVTDVVVQSAEMDGSVLWLHRFVDTEQFSQASAGHILDVLEIDKKFQALMGLHVFERQFAETDDVGCIEHFRFSDRRDGDFIVDGEFEFQRCIWHALHVSQR